MILTESHIPLVPSRQKTLSIVVIPRVPTSQTRTLRPDTLLNLATGMAQLNALPASPTIAELVESVVSSTASTTTATGTRKGRHRLKTRLRFRKCTKRLRSSSDERCVNE